MWQTDTGETTHFFGMPMQSESLKELAKALNKVQAEIGAAIKNKENPFFHSNYADLACVWETIRESLTNNGFCVMQTFLQGEKGPLLETMLLHLSGEWKRGTIEINPEKNTPQGVGSAITYYRRYSLAAMVGVVQEDEDDDGEGAMDRNGGKKKPAKAKKESKYTTAKDYIARINELNTGPALRKWWEKYYAEIKKHKDYEAITAAKDKRKTELQKPALPKDTPPQDAQEQQPLFDQELGLARGKLADALNKRYNKDEAAKQRHLANAGINVRHGDSAGERVGSLSLDEINVAMEDLPQ